jgi:hypothetical protein
VTGTLLAALLLPGALPLAAAHDASADAARSATSTPARAPAWNELSAEQREALAPLRGEWDHFDTVRRRKWIEIAAHYRDLSPEGKQRMHERMPELARLTPEQRATAHENFKRAYTLPAEQRKAATERFENLPDDKKRELAERTRKRGEPPRRPGSGTAATGAAGTSPATTPGGMAAASPAPAP